MSKKYKIVQRLSAAPREELPLALVLQALASAVFVSIFLLLCLFSSISSALSSIFFLLMMWVYLFEKRLSFITSEASSVLHKRHNFSIITISFQSPLKHVGPQ